MAEPEGAIMQTTITVRHCEISDALRAHAVSVVERLGGLAPRPMDMTVVFDTDGTKATAELRLHLAHGEVLVAKEKETTTALHWTGRKRSSGVRSSGSRTVPAGAAPPSRTIHSDASTRRLPLPPR